MWSFLFSESRTVSRGLFITLYHIHAPCLNGFSHALPFYHFYSSRGNSFLSIHGLPITSYHTHSEAAVAKRVDWVVHWFSALAGNGWMRGWIVKGIWLKQNITVGAADQMLCVFTFDTSNFCTNVVIKSRSCGETESHSTSVSRRPHSFLLNLRHLLAFRCLKPHTAPLSTQVFVPVLHVKWPHSHTL